MFEKELPFRQLMLSEEIGGLTEFVIFDSEYTAWPGSLESGWTRPGEIREMFQWGLLRVKRECQGQPREEAATEIIIKTVIVPQLPEYSISLTGVPQLRVDTEGIPFFAALEKMYQFSRSGELPILSYGGDRHVLADNCAMLAVTPPTFAAGFLDIRPLLHRTDPRTCALSSGQLHTLAPEDSLEGRIHDALHDVRSVCAYLAGFKL